MSKRYAFGEFVLERSQQRLQRRDGAPVILSPRLFAALLLLVERAGRQGLEELRSWLTAN
jgi:DNA-binding winged helix-turn-helix (wHTH) protein